MVENPLIKELLVEGEGLTVEFLEKTQNDRIAKTVCAFLNAEGGRLLIGVSDSGEPIGVQNDPLISNRLQNFLFENILPEAPISVDLEFLGKNRLPILSIKVAKGSRQPYIYDSAIYFRRGATTRKATSHEISDIIHGRQSSELHWERQATLGIELFDLDQALIKETINESVNNGRGNFKGSETLDFLTYYGLYLNGAFTNACVILFAKNPARFIPQIRVRLTEYAEGKTDNNLLRDIVFEGNLFKTLQDLEMYVNGLGTRSVFDKNQWKRKDFSFPKKALQEGIVNALMHRDYSSPSSGVAIEVYPDRFVITNSGKLPDDIEVKDLKRNHISHPVNPDIAHVVFLRGFIDKLGRGTIKVLNDCKEAGLRTPQWKESNNSVSLTFYGPKALPERRDRIGDAVNDAVNDAASDAVKEYISDAVSDAINDAASDAVIKRTINELMILLAQGRKSLNELMTIFGVARATMQRDMALLKAHQFVVFEGSPKSGAYKLTDEFQTKIEQQNKK